jgi:hypothetical protein
MGIATRPPYAPFRPAYQEHEEGHIWMTRNLGFVREFRTGCDVYGRSGARFGAGRLYARSPAIPEACFAGRARTWPEYSPVSLSC